MKTQFKKLFMLSLCLLCFGISSSYAQGIKWNEDLNWEQITAKAKAENKYIFVDCYATWCGPCKQMDQDVYPIPAVGEAVNEKFISVKVQMDSTKNDSENVKKSYRIARTFEKTYGIAGLPAYLFFSADGEIVHKAMGFQKAEDFNRLVKDVQIPEKQLYTQIKACRAGKMDVNLVPSFIRRLNDGGDNTTALELSRSYMKNHLEDLPEARFATKENLQLMWDFQQMSRTEDRIFKLCREKPDLVNTVYNNPELANIWISNLLRMEYIAPAIEAGIKNKREPDWKVIYTALENKSDSEAVEDILIDAKRIWNCSIKDWDKACDYEILKFKRKDLKKLPQDQINMELNTIAWTLFTYSFSKKQLNQGLAWIDEALRLSDKPYAVFMDTKANILYKLGRKQEAITLQEKAAASPSSWKTAINAALEKMKLGEPSWPTSKIGVDQNKQVK